MGIQTRKADCASKVSSLPLLERVLALVQVLLSKPEVDDVNLAHVLTENKVGGLHISVNILFVMYFLDCLKHLYEQLNSNLKMIMRLKTLPDLGEVITQQIHDNQVLLSIFNEIESIADVLGAMQVAEYVVLKQEYTFIFVLFLHLQGHILL